MVTERLQYPARMLLAPIAARRALRYLDLEGTEVTPNLSSVAAEQPELEEVRHHRVTLRMVEVNHPTVAVFISPAGPAMQDLSVLTQMQVPTLTFTDSVLEADVDAEMGDVEDPTQRLLRRTPVGRWSRPRQPEEVRALPPYPYLMQRLVAEWTGRQL